MFRIITNPIQRLSEIIDRPDWKRPLIVFLIITAVVAILATYFYVIPNRESLFADRALTPEQTEHAKRFMASPVAIAISPISAAVVTVARILLFTLFFYLTMSLLEVKKPFKEVLNITTNSALIGVVGYIIKTPLMIMTAKPPNTSLSLMLSEGEKASFLYKLLTRIEFFAGWEMIVLIIGLAMLTRTDWKRIAVIVIPCWILYNVVRASLDHGRPF